MNKLEEIVESPISKYLGFSEKEIVTALIDSRTEEMDEDFIRMLLYTKFSYLDKFKWDIYRLDDFEMKRGWEIYLTNTEESEVDVNKSVYVPVRALIINDSQMIIDHTKQYFSQHRAGRNPNVKKHNHNKRNQLIFTCPVCQQARYEKDILPLEGTEFKKLKEEMIKNE